MRHSTRFASALIVALAAATSTACSDAPEPGEQLEVEDESPLITDPGGVANDVTGEQPDDGGPTFDDADD